MAEKNTATTPEKTTAKAEPKVKKAKKSASQKPGFFAGVKNFFSRMVKYFKDTKSELKKVVWPSKKQVRINTITVIVVVIIAAVVMLLLDVLFGGAIHLMISGGLNG